MYEVDYIAWKALDDIEALTKDVDIIGKYTNSNNFSLGIFECEVLGSS